MLVGHPTLSAKASLVLVELREPRQLRRGREALVCNEVPSQASEADAAFHSSYAQGRNSGGAEHAHCHIWLSQILQVCVNGSGGGRVNSEYDTGQNMIGTVICEGNLVGRDIYKLCLQNSIFASSVSFN